MMGLLARVKAMSQLKTYSELSKLLTFAERFRYLKLDGGVGQETFGSSRYLNQFLYRSNKWKEVRRHVLLRDLGCDLGIEGFEIQRFATIHHMNPITEEDILKERYCVFDPENLITVSNETHRALHYGDERILFQTKQLVERKPYDHIPWGKEGGTNA